MTRQLLLWPRLALILGLTAALLTSCSKEDKDDKKGGKDTPDQVTTAPGTNRLQDLDKIKIVGQDGKALVKAQVLIGNSLNQPFTDNFVETDVDGIFKVPAGWTTEMAVTISAAGYNRATYLKQKPEGQVYTLRPQAPAKTLELSGTQTGFNVIDKDGTVDFGLVIPTLTKQDLFNFDVGMVISSQVDEISILGQTIKIPSNVGLPKQKETYIFNITLEKPVYRMYFGNKGPKNIFSARGQFPLKPVVDEMRAGKSFFELANYFKINGGALRKVDITGDKTKVDLPVMELNFNQSRSLQSPVFDQEQVLMTLALSEDQGAMFPTDMKSVAGNSKITLVTAQGSTPLLLTVLKNKTETNIGPGMDRLSATLLPFENGVAPQMLAIMKNPQVIGLTHFKADVVNAVKDTSPVGSYAVLSTVTEKVVDGVTYQSLTTLWEVYDRNWSPEYDLPVWPTNTLPKGKKRWEVSRAASLTKSFEELKFLDLGPGLFDSVTHATHSSADF